MSGPDTRDGWARVKEIFHAAIAQPPADRAGYAARACGSDDTIRAEVERLLAAHFEAGDFIEPPAAGLTGRRIGRYDVGEPIGRGGMGEVYAARDVELGRDVAIKIGRTVDGDSRLRREAQNAAQLNHPHVCTIHEVGAFDGRCYVVMERVHGQPLSALIAPAGLSDDDLLRYGAQIADAVAHAHRHGVVHRDLKAANIVVTPDGRAKVLDFGLSRALPVESRALTGAAPAVTAEGTIAGTLAYMAPELLRGEPADEQTDVWALGVLLYEMATGARPFGGATDFELCASILHEPPPPLPARVPAALHQVIHGCLEKERTRRYRSGGEVHAALENVRRAPAARALARPRLAARVMTWRAAAALLSVAVAVAAGAAAWRMGGATPPRVPAGASGRPAIAVMPFDDLTGGQSAWLAKGVQNMLLTGLAQIPSFHLVSSQRLSEAAREIGPSGTGTARDHLFEAARRAGAGGAVVGSIVQSGNTIRIDAQIEDLASGRVLAGTTVSGTDLFALVDQLAARLRDQVGLSAEGAVRSITEVSSASLDAYRLYSEGVDAFVNYRTDAAQRLLEQAVGIDPAFADAYLQLALISGPAGRPGERRGYLRKAAAHRDRLTGRRRLLLEAELARDDGRFADAARRLDELIARFPDDDAIATLGMQLYTPVVGPLPDAGRLLDVQRAAVAASPASAYTRNNLAYALSYAGRFDEAIRELEAAARLAPRQPAPYDGLGETYLMMGRIDEALASFARALAIDPTFPFSRRGRAWTLAVSGRLDEALAESASASHLTAVVLARAGRFREAYATIADAARTARGGGDDVRLAGLHLLSAMLALERADAARALDACRMAQATLAQVPEERRRFIALLGELLAGVAEARLGRPERARAHLETQVRLYHAGAGDPWWQRALEGEIALAEGNLDSAAAAFARAEPPRKQFFSGLIEGSVLSNDLQFRDGPARVATVRQDWPRAIDRYRRLLTYGPDQKWVAVFEPRYVLEIARLLERMGDTASARAQYERFLQLWRRADPGLPEAADARRALARLAGATMPAIRDRPATDR